MMSLNSVQKPRKNNRSESSHTTCRSRRNCLSAPYSTQKAATCQTGKVTQVDTIADKAYYYTLTMTTSDKTVSCPIMNANGEVLGLIQKSASEEDKESYAIGASYGESLSISPYLPMTSI